jgi:hypothetical protein
MDLLGGIPSDEAPEILAAGRNAITTVFVSMSARHPEGADAEYLRWHTFDLRPEQHRIPSVRASLRLVSTPPCRASRAASDDRYDAVDHVMTYFFTDSAGLHGFAALNAALRAAGRKPYVVGDHKVGPEEERLLPQVELGVYSPLGMAAAPRVKVGAEVLPWFPMRGVYLIVERGEAPPRDLLEVGGVAGVWWLTARDPGAEFAAESAEQSPDPLVGEVGVQLIYCFLDDDPIDAAVELRPVLEKRWADGTEPLLAAPFHPVAGYEFDRYLP